MTYFGSSTILDMRESHKLGYRALLGRRVCGRHLAKAAVWDCETEGESRESLAEGNSEDCCRMQVIIT